MELTFEDFVKMEEIDHQYFPDENVSPADEAYKWYLADKNSCIVVKDKSNVVACVNILSLKKDIYDKVKHNQMNESQILVTDLELDKDKYFNYLYFSSIAIDKKHRDIQTLRKLIRLTTQKIIEIINLGFKIKEVMADCSTAQGQKITQRFLKLRPFMETSHNSTIHVLNGKEFTKQVFKYINSDKNILQGRQMKHIAILRQPFFDMVLSGEKTIESRWSMNKIAPYNKVSVGDEILLKLTGQPVTATAKVKDVRYYELTPEKVEDIRIIYGKEIGTDKFENWQSTLQKKYCTLIWLDNVKRISPIRVERSNGAGWIVVKD